MLENPVSMELERFRTANIALSKQLGIVTKERYEARRQLAHITDTIKIDEDE